MSEITLHNLMPSSTTNVVAGLAYAKTKIHTANTNNTNGGAGLFATRRLRTGSRRIIAIGITVLSAVHDAGRKGAGAAALAYCRGPLRGATPPGWARPAQRAS